MNSKLCCGYIEEIGKTHGDIMNYFPAVQAQVKVWAIEVLKRLINNGGLEQDNLLDNSNHDMLMNMLSGLIRLAWKELSVDINNKVLLLNNDELSKQVYYYLKNDLRLLVMNYGVNKSDKDFIFADKKKILLNTIEHLKEKSKYLEEFTELKDQYDKALIDLEYKVDYHGNTAQLKALLKAMKKSRIHLLLNVGESDEIWIYPEILDVFKDYFYLKYAFYFGLKEIDRLKRNFKNNQNIKMTDDRFHLLRQLNIVNRNQISSIIRHAYEEKYMYDSDDFKVLLRQLFHENVNNNREFANHIFKESPFIPLHFFKYTMLGR